MATGLHAARNSETEPQNLQLTSYWRPTLRSAPASDTRIRAQILRAHVHAHCHLLCTCTHHFKKSSVLKGLYGCHELLWLILSCEMKEVLMNLAFTTNSPNQSSVSDLPLPSHKYFQSLMFMVKGCHRSLLLSICPNGA